MELMGIRFENGAWIQKIYFLVALTSCGSELKEA
jgi:hypothetical protein